MNSFDDWNGALCHHGIKGQKWGLRRYQNPDGTLTAEGIQRYRHTMGEVLRGARKNGSSHMNSTPESLGYIPTKGRRGDRVQRDMARTQMSLERKAAKYSEKALNKNSMDYQRNVYKAKRFAESANMMRAMQKRYNELGPSDQKMIRNGRKLMTAGYFFGGAIGGAVGAAVYASRINRLEKNTAQDMQRNPKKYDWK